MNLASFFSSLPLAGETTEGEADCEDFFSLLEAKGRPASSSRWGDQWLRDKVHSVSHRGPAVLRLDRGITA
jgi:hypothetical protein